MRPRSSSTGRNTSASVTVTVTGQISYLFNPNQDHNSRHATDVLFAATLGADAVIIQKTTCPPTSWRLSPLPTLLPLWHSHDFRFGTLISNTSDIVSFNSLDIPRSYFPVVHKRMFPHLIGGPMTQGPL